jgi:NAD+ kinase
MIMPTPSSLHQSPVPQSMAIVYHPTLPSAAMEAEAIAEFLQARGIPHASGTLDDLELGHCVQCRQYDLLIALGGDGTMLRAGHLCAAAGIPIMGVNMGHFGFLYETQRTTWRNDIAELLKGNYWLEQRMLLHAALYRQEVNLGEWDVLNDVVVCRGAIVRPVKLTAYVDGYLLTTYIADGLIASTPTGSTAYALAVGGPILPPELRNILIIPVAPHLSVNRGIILPEGASVSITVNTSHQAVASLDGQTTVPMLDGDKVLVTVADQTLKFVRFQDPGYFYRNLTVHMEHNPSSGVSQ